MKRLGLYAGLSVVLFLIGFSLARNAQARVETVRHTQVMMGTLVDIQVRESDRAKGEQAIAAAFAEMRRVERLFSTTEQGEVWALNHNPQESVEVGADLLYVISSSDAMWRMSAGAFDAGMNNLIDLWGFGTETQGVPAPAALEAARQASGWSSVRLEENRIVRPPGLGLNFGGIAIGYAVDRAIVILQEHGIGSALVNAGGEIRTLGSGWVIGIQHPRRANQIMARIRPGELAVATSGDYEKYFEVDGQRYHHLLDPHTGFPFRGVQSVTILAPTCTDADGLSTAVFVLGVQHGLALIETLADTEAFLVDENGVVHMSSGFEQYLVERELESEWTQR
ncbi:MAG: FAD:protein FMN transferase [Anaerolineaceae bacterium]|jgi:thiamine biosynthesis lipoprotein